MRATSERRSISSASCVDAAEIISTYRSVGGSSPPKRISVRANPCAVASGVRRSWHASETRRAKDVSSGAGMAEPRNLITHDLQASAPEVRIGLSRVGVTGVSKAIRLSHAGTEKLIAAEIDCTVDLD